jgi:lipoprotein-anchoring transpeptidase ErfK/SrfK
VCFKGVGDMERPGEKEAEKQAEKVVENLVELETEEKLENPEEGTREEQKEEMIENPEENPEEEVQVEELVEEGEEGVLEDTEENEAEEQTEEGEENPVKEDSPAGEPVEKEEENKKIKRKTIIIASIVSLCTLLVIYFGMTKYFTNHFYFGSEINAISVSGKTLQDAEALVAAQLQDYNLNLRLRGGKSEQIKASEVGLKYNSEEEIKKFMDSQNPFGWVSAVFNKENSKLTVGVTYDEELLKERIDALSCFDSSNITEPKNPSFQYAGNSYVIVDEIPGNKVDKDALLSQVASSLLKKEAEIDLDVAGCYVKPQYDSKSPKIIEVKDTLNKYISSKITYTFGDRKEVIDGSTINKWLTVDENFVVKVNEDKAKAYIDSLSKTYNTAGKTRSFVTSSGNTISIGGGDYGWSINKTKETQSLISAIKQGQTITREPAATEANLPYSDIDIGNTYVEIDLTKQKIWFYKNGSLVVHGNIVSGNVRGNTQTRKGIFRLKLKQRNRILSGDDYAVHVDYWMPFDGGIGIHDASWRSSFGGTIYKTNGSHGCVNSPYNVAQTIYNNIEVGTPVIVH